MNTRMLQSRGYPSIAKRIHSAGFVTTPLLGDLALGLARLYWARATDGRMNDQESTVVLDGERTPLNQDEAQRHELTVPVDEVSL